MLSLGTNQLQKHLRNNQRISRFQLCNQQIWFVLLFFPSPPALWKQVVFIEAACTGQLADGSLQLDIFSTFSSTTPASDRKEVFLSPVSGGKGGLRGVWDEMRWDEICYEMRWERGREEEENEKSWANHIFFSCNILWSPSGLVPEKKRVKFKSFFFCSVTLLFSHSYFIISCYHLIRFIFH